jgi:hypothetical protein
VYCKVKIRRIFPVIILGFLLLGFPSCKYIRQRLSIGEYSLEAAIEWAKKDSARVADSLKRVIADKNAIITILPDSMKKVLAEKKDFERTLTDSLTSIGDNDRSPENPGSGYHIIAGSFSSHDNALAKLKICVSQGYKATIINYSGRDGTKLELVSVRTFKDHNEATVFLRQFQSEHDPGAWIYSQR